MHTFSVLHGAFYMLLNLSLPADLRMRIRIHFHRLIESVRLHYSVDQVSANVTIRIFDFGMNLVRTVISDANRGGIAEHDEIWDGKNDKGRQVSNGPYFYEVVVGTEKPIWGKILVLQ